MKKSLALSIIILLSMQSLTVQAQEQVRAHLDTAFLFRKVEVCLELFCEFMIHF